MPPLPTPKPDPVPLRLPPIGRAELSRPIVPRTPRRRQRTHHAGRASCSAHRPPQLRHTGAATAPCYCSSSNTRGAQASATITPHHPTATPPAAILCVDCSSHRPRPSLSHRTTRPFLRLPSPAARTGWDRTGRGEIAESRPGGRGGRAVELSPGLGSVPRAPSGTVSNVRYLPLFRLLGMQRSMQIYPLTAAAVEKGEIIRKGKLNCKGQATQQGD
ncbi:uncharacterized protein LOC111932477 [Cyanistes caeruleus]|uniref:uncharacterized protein LOC111932477 n=1 Tax=Cyanistes caeruleus TaxID=156563 RepID=UPI000CDB81DA|nr:uncharacterized protein LOC111932477 [Cyanistes caeruleus]